ncbi:MAG: ATP-dependent DNA helicase [Actinomycetota bacterium]|nr:ATP-dependent DNA helicase [Actinomycetota bacterium]
MPGRSRLPAIPPVADLLAVGVRAIDGTPRAGQQQMAAAVDTAMHTDEHLLVQAGTGTGKSLAYLVPALRHAVENGEPVVVSTATLALQAQIVDHDLPVLVDALERLLGRRPEIALVKGRAHYACRHKLAGGYPAEEPTLFDPAAASGPTSSWGAAVVRLRDWVESSKTGDRSELVPGVPDRAWRQVSVTAHECLGGQRCPQAASCFSELSRAKARESDIVVTNHAFLAIDAFEGRAMLPEHQVVIIDEAHELADRVTGVISDQLSAVSVSAAAGAAARHAEVDSDRLTDAAAELSAALDELESGRFPDVLPEALHRAVAAVRDAARGALTSLPAAVALLETAGTQGAQQLARGALSEIFDVAERLTKESDQDVSWLSVSDYGPGAPRRVLQVAPLSVAELLRERLFAERTVILTSATLTVGGSFDATAEALGLAGNDAPAWRGQDVGSPFDYPKQGILYVAKHLPPPGRDGLGAPGMDEIAALVQAAGGRTLGLFSSRRAAEAAAQEMRERLDVPVLCQGDDATPTLMAAFAADPRTCLFGTLSLWQGVDVPGPTCQLVLIDRIPFPRPDDPLMSARATAVTRAGGNGFMSVSASHAGLLLAQGSGRLIRTATDRGVVAVLDSRLASARYASFLRASMPAFWSTTDREVVLGALRRLDRAAGSTEDAPPPGTDPVATALAAVQGSPRVD